MEEKDTKELIRDLVASVDRILDILGNKATFGNEQERECFMPVYQSMAYDKLEQAMTRVLDSDILDEDQRRLYRQYLKRLTAGCLTRSKREVIFMDKAGEKIRKLREDKDRLILKNYELAQGLGVYRELFRNLVNSSQGLRTALQDIINIVNSGPVDDDAAGKIRDICNRRLFSSFDEGEPNDDHQSAISDLCSYIWEEFRRAEDDQAAGKDNDCFSNEDGEMGYYMGKYVAMKKIVESDEFKKLEDLLEKEKTNGSV